MQDYLLTNSLFSLKQQNIVFSLSCTINQTPGNFGEKVLRETGCESLSNSSTIYHSQILKDELKYDIKYERIFIGFLWGGEMLEVMEVNFRKRDELLRTEK